MSTRTPTRETTVVPRPRSAVEPPATPVDPPRPAAPEEPAGVYARHPWLIPATGIALVLATFLSMVLLTWAAGGGTPFDR